VPDEVIAVFIETADGHRQDASLSETEAGQRRVTVNIQTSDTIAIFVRTGAGLFPVHFSASPRAQIDRTAIPSFSGTLDVGRLTPCTCGPGGAAFEPEHNPLALIDTDGDSVHDLNDIDDDDDGVLDEVDEDSDGNGVLDITEDLDSDDDCIPDLCDQDGDGVLDALGALDDDPAESEAVADVEPADCGEDEPCAPRG